MLSELRVRNYAVIEDLSLRLDPGLLVLTGETGAGKSIIVGALSLVLGERATSEVVRSGEEKSVIEAVIEIDDRHDIRERCDEAGIDVSEGLLVLKREVSVGGRNRAWINGSPATASLAGELGQLLVDLHGQHEHQALLHASSQREILDAYGDASEQAEDVADAPRSGQSCCATRPMRSRRPACASPTRISRWPTRSDVWRTERNCSSASAISMRRSTAVRGRSTRG